jgi:YVTN family beta-propeller protein
VGITAAKEEMNTAQHPISAAPSQTQLAHSTPYRLATVFRFTRSLPISLCCTLALLAGCRRNYFPDVPVGYHEFAYISNGAANTVSVLDLVYLRQDRTLQVGPNPTGLAVNPARNEVYVVNTGSPTGNGSISVIDSVANRVVATIPVHKLPYFISVDPTGHRAFVANSGSNTVSVIDLDRRREVVVAGAGEQPGLARISPDGRSLVVTNRGSNSVSIYEVMPHTDASAPAKPANILQFRATFAGCPGATDAAILPDSSKTFIACSSGHQVMAIALAAAPGSWPARQDSTALTDHFLTLLDVGLNPVHLALKPNGGEIFSSNFAADSVSEIDTWNNQVLSTFPIGDKPVHGVVSNDNAFLWVSNFGADSVSFYSIDDGHLVTSIRTGSAPDAIAFSTDEHLLLTADAHSGDVAIIRTQGNPLPTLFTTLPAGLSPNAIVVKSFIRAKTAP